jgi:hypothetical protein
VGLVASRDSDGLPDGGKADILEDFHCFIGGLLFEDRKVDLFLHDVYPNFDIWLREALIKGLLDLGGAIGAPDSTHLNGENSWNSSCMYF